MKIKMMFFPLIAVILSICHGVTSNQIPSSSLPSPSPTKLENMKTINEYHMQYDNQTGLPSIGDCRFLSFQSRLTTFLSLTTIKKHFIPPLMVQRAKQAGNQFLLIIKSQVMDTQFIIRYYRKYVSPHDRAYFEEYANAGDQMAISRVFIQLKGLIIPNMTVMTTIYR